MSQTVGLTEDPQLEIVSAYAAGSEQIPAVAVGPGWYVVGAFRVTSSYAEARLEAVGVVAEAGLVMRVRLFDLETNQSVPTSVVSIVSTLDEAVVSAAFDVFADRVYQVQCEVVGPSSFGVFKTATLV